MSIYLIFMLLFLLQIILIAFSRKFIKRYYFKLNNKKINLHDFIVFLLLFFDFIVLIYFSSVRGPEIGTDLKTYLYYLKVIKESSASLIFYAYRYGIEIGFVVMNRLVSFFGDDILFQFVTSIFIYIPIMLYIRKNSKNMLISLFIFLCFGYYNQSFNIIRQYIALSILLMSFEFVKSKNLMKFVSLVLLAFLFHKTAIIFLIIYPIYWVNIKIKYFNLKFLIIIVLIYIFKSEITTLLTNTFYSNYAGEREGTYGLSLIINLSIYVLLNFYANKNNSREIRFYLYMCCLTILLNILGMSMDLFVRIMLYFKIFFITSIPNIIDGIKNKKEQKIITICIILLFGIYYFYNISYGNLYDTVPYIKMTGG